MFKRVLHPPLVEVDQNILQYSKCVGLSQIEAVSYFFRLFDKHHPQFILGYKDFSLQESSNSHCPSVKILAIFVMLISRGVWAKHRK